MALTRVIVLAIATSIMASAVAVLPGTPCIDLIQVNRPCDVGHPSTPGVAAVDPLFNLGDPSVTDLKMFVVPGDVILFETATGTDTDRTTWSDLLHFATGPNSSSATVYPDLENGVIGLPTGFTLSANHVSLLESLTENFTEYVAGSNTYRVFSDCSGPGCEIPEPGEGVPEPATMGLLGFGVCGVLSLRRVFARLQH